MLIALENAGLELNQQVLLRNISLTIQAGNVLQIRGANGSGKSSLLKLLHGDHWQTSGTRTYYFSTPRASPIGAKEQMALVSPEIQERYQRLGYNRSALEVIQSGYRQTDYLQGQLEPDQTQHSLEFAAKLHLGHLLEQPLTKLSKGQMRQVLLARALILEPRLLLLDEFFSGIDSTAQNHLRQLIQRYLAGGGTLIYTTHRQEEPFIGHEQHVLLENGQIITAFQSTKTLPKLVPTTHVSHQILIEICNANVFSNQPEDDATAADGHAPQPPKQILEHINFSLRQGQHWLITGHNGAGKSTLAKLIRGDISPAIGGTVEWFGSSQTPIWQRHAKIALVSSDSQAFHRTDATGFEIIASGLSGAIGWHRPLTDPETTRVQQLLDSLGINHLEQRNALHVSQGELRKLLLARALVTQPEIIILDEAFDYLDPTSRSLIWMVLQQQNATLIIIAHRTEDEPPFSTQQLVLENGKIKDAVAADADTPVAAPSAKTVDSRT